MERPIKVLIAKVGLDGHDRGAKVIARGLKDQGMEVVYTGLRQTPEKIVRTAIQEDVDVIGISILSGSHMELIPNLLNKIKENGLSNVIVIVGGIIPKEDAQTLIKMGVDAVYPPGSSMKEIADFIRKAVSEKRR
ncbi:methylmalonyl-CoA mutase [Sulfolobales archaeon HS-7]|nr:methylmalonyl-CoA mutase [Sulfolobales archaeon HS-7]